MHRIAIIIPFFGTWPKWITLFFDSCRWNSTIDFFFFSDCDTSDFKSKDIPNIFFYDIGFGDYCDMVSQRLGINFHPTSAYKLCDLKE